MHNRYLIFIIILAIDCGTLSSPANGQVNIPTTTLWSTATYSCISGYRLNGTSIRICEGSGSWSGTAPTCEGNYSFYYQAGA